MKCWQLAYIYRYMFLRVRVYVNKYFIFNTIIYVVYFHISVTFHTASSSTQKKCHLVRWNGFKNVKKCGNLVSYWSKITGRGNVTVMSFLINCVQHIWCDICVYILFRQETFFEGLLLNNQKYFLRPSSLYIDYNQIFLIFEFVL